LPEGTIDGVRSQCEHQTTRASTEEQIAQHWRREVGRKATDRILIVDWCFFPRREKPAFGRNQLDSFWLNTIAQIDVKEIE